MAKNYGVAAASADLNTLHSGLSEAVASGNFSSIFTKIKAAASNLASSINDDNAVKSYEELVNLLSFLRLMPSNSDMPSIFKQK